MGGDDIGYGTVMCRGCGQQVALYVMGYMVEHRDREGIRCGLSHWR